VAIDIAVSSYAVPAARCGEGNAAGVTWGDSLGKGDAGRRGAFSPLNPPWQYLLR
jgi:hypothetical protein